MRGDLDGDRSEFLAVRGQGTSPGLACGPLLRNRTESSPHEVRGAIVLAERAVPDDLARILASSGTVTMGGGILSHVSLLARELGKPSVCLAAGGPVRIAREGGAGLLELAEAIIEEGDVVLLDGDRGTLRIPGGCDRDSRRGIRRLYATLLCFARDPGEGPPLREIREEAQDPRGPGIPFLLEAGLVHRMVPEGRPARALIETLSQSAVGRAVVEPRLELLRARLLASAAGRRHKAMEALRLSADPEELDRIVGRFESYCRHARALLLDLGKDPTDLDRALQDVGREARARRDTLKAHLRREVSLALELPERAEEVDAHAPLVVLLDAEGPSLRSLLGGKATGFLQVRDLFPAGCRIPRGFIVTSAAYRLHLRGKIRERLALFLREGGDPAQVSRRARAALLSQEIPEEVVQAVSSSLAALRSSKLAVRSSATVEDGPAGSLAGQFDTYLGVRGLPELLNRIRRAWASLWNVRALTTLAGAGLSPLEASQAVIVQEMIETRAAGVVAFRDAARGADTLLVNAAWGLGEGISLGGVAGDVYWVRRSTGDLLAKEVGAETRQVVLDPSGTGTIECPLPPDRAGRPCLNDGELRRLAALARALEASGRTVHDVEFGFAEDQSLVVFQVRPVIATVGCAQ